MPSPLSLPAEAIEIAEDSYRRIQSPKFFQAFYRRFLDSDPRIPPMFADTDFERQGRLLQHSIGLLFVYAKRRNPAMLERIASRHGHGDLNVAPEYYPLWVDALVETVREFDDACNPSIEQAWRQAVQPGIEHMISWYRRDSTEGPAAS